LRVPLTQVNLRAADGANEYPLGEIMLMKKMFVLTVVVIAAAVALSAQEMPRVEVFGGYSYFHVPSSSAQKGFGLNGWNAQGSVNLNKWLGFTGDFGGYYGSPFSVSVHSYSYMFGPTLSYRAQHVTPFAHALFGGGHLSAAVGGPSSSRSSFAMAMGGGLDLPLKGHFGVRAAQVDWVRTEFFKTTQNNVRVSTGVMFRF
jgi:peptidoglycan-associated lipoprotein